MPITRLSVSGYRSINDLSLPLGPVNVIVGPNGCGKTNLYRSLYLIAAAAQGTFAQALADEGGMPSVLWAGQRPKKGPVRMSLGIEVEIGSATFIYDLACGLPQSESVTRDAPSLFTLDPQIKEERLCFVERRRRSVLMDRDRGSATALDSDGARVQFPMALSLSESALSQIREPQRFPYLSALREEILHWRFYHQFRTDPDSPLRRPRVGVKTPVLSSDGSDLAAALQTIFEYGDGIALTGSLEQAFPDSRLVIEGAQGRYTLSHAGCEFERRQPAAAGGTSPAFSLSLHQADFQRPFTAQELSDGTLRYLCLLAALLSPLPPPVIALNEPETSLHPDLLLPLAALIVKAAQRSQVWITTHSTVLADAIRRDTGAPPIRLAWDGETRVSGRGTIGGFVTDD